MSLDEKIMQEYQKAMNKVCKWRAVFAGWQLGTRSADDPEAQAVRNTAEALIIHRIELNAVVALLIYHGVTTEEEWTKLVTSEAKLYDKALEEQFPGMKSSDSGMVMDAQTTAKTMKGWRP